MVLGKRVEAEGRRGGGSFAIVASRYNAVYVEGMLDACRRRLSRAGVGEAGIVVHRVPGAFEIPVVAAVLAHRSVHRPDAIIALGVVIQGATDHARHIGGAVSQTLAHLQVRYRIPVVHEVLSLVSEEQARARCLDPECNRGAEAAATALEMVEVVRSLRAGQGGGETL